MSILTSLYTSVMNGVCEIIGGVRYVLCDIIIPVIRVINPFIHNRELNIVQMTPILTPLVPPILPPLVSPIISPITSNRRRISIDTERESREYYYTTPILYGNIFLLYYISLIIFIIIII